MKNLDIVLDNPKFLAGFTTRLGGVSNGAYAELNLADHVGDLPENVAKNREILAKKLGVQNLKFMHQIHSNHVFVLSDLSEQIPPCDAIITNLRGLALCVLVADCSPILILDSVRNVVAVVHSGRAGVVGRICSNTINLMKSKFSCHSSDMKIFVGANIKARNYEIGDLYLGEFNRFKIGGNFDINAALADEFDTFGVKNVVFDSRCTFESEELFSYRRDGITGRFAGFVMVK